MKIMRVKKTILKAVLLLTACGVLADNLPASLRQGRLSAQSSATLGDIEPLLKDFFTPASTAPVVRGDGGRSVVAPEKSAGEAQVPPPSPAEPGTRDYYERHIVGKYVMDGDALVGISGTDAGVGVRFRTAEWLEGSVLETHGTNLLVVGQVVTNASGAVRTERLHVLSPLPDQPARTTNAWLRALVIRDGTYRYTTESGTTGTLSGWREVRGPTFEEYRRIYERDLEAAKKGDRIEIKGESQFEPLSRPLPMSYADRLRERTRPKTQAEHSTEEAMRQRQRIARLARETAAIEIARREAEAASNKIGQQTPAPLITPLRKAEAAADPSVGTNGFYVYTLNGSGQASITGFDKAFVGELTVTHLLGGCPVTEIGKNAFAGCQGITEVILPASLVTIGDTAFNGCGNLVRLTISDSVKEIGVRAFQSCGKLEALTIPASVTTIKEAAFEYCHSLKTVFVPAGVTTLGGNPFGGCGHLQSVTVDPANPAYLSDAEGVVFNKDKTELVAVPATRTGEYKVPEGVTNILRGAFLLCKGLNSVQLPSSLKRLGGCAFFVCSNLRSVTLAEGVESIGMQAFESCSQLETITLPASVRHLESWAFQNASGLRSVRFLKDAPDGAGNTTLFHNCPEAVIYRNPDAKGWGESFGGRPVKVWDADKQ